MTLGTHNDIVRQAYGAGRWFPADREELTQTVERYIEAVDIPSFSGRILAGISPHAGYPYSGKVAGYTFWASRESAKKYGCDTVVILGACHRASFEGVAVMDGDSIETPFGATPLDKKAADILTKTGSRVKLDYSPHMGEHSVENQIPFAQYALPDAKLVLGLIGDHNQETLDDLQRALVTLSEFRKIIVVASTDLLHDADYNLVSKTDAETMSLIAGMERKKLEKNWSFENQTCCGISSVLAAMRFAESQGVEKGTQLCYCNSGDEFPESRGNWVVGYGSVIFGCKE